MDESLRGPRKGVEHRKLEVMTSTRNYTEVSPKTCIQVQSLNERRETYLFFYRTDLLGENEYF